MADKVQVVVFRRLPDGVEFLQLQRIPEKQEEWQSITANVEKTDSDLESTVLRELEEETGIATIVAFHGPLFSFSFVGRLGDTTEHVFAVEVGDVDVRLDKNVCIEHQAYAWVSFEEAVKRVRWDSSKKALRTVYALVSA